MLIWQNLGAPTDKRIGKDPHAFNLGKMSGEQERTARYQRIRRGVGSSITRLYRPHDQTIAFYGLDA